MAGETVSATAIVNAPAQAAFAVLADPEGGTRAGFRAPDGQRPVPGEQLRSAG
jgi:hypothetical protein